MFISLGSVSIVFIDASNMVSRNTSPGRGLLQAAAFSSSLASMFLFLSMYSIVKPLKKFYSSNQR
jgi:hypothetical protein